MPMRTADDAAPRLPAVTEEVRVRAGRGYWRSATVVAVPGPAFNFVWVQVPGESHDPALSPWGPRMTPNPARPKRTAHSSGNSDTSLLKLAGAGGGRSRHLS